MNDSPTSGSLLDFGDGVQLAYRHTPGRDPTVVFLCGYRSDMNGSKALHLEHVCESRAQAYLRFDYRGHGLSSGAFEDGSIGAWADDATRVIEAVTQGPVVLVGSSMGGWIMLLVAQRLIDRVRALVGIASAPDFTEDLIRQHISAEQQAILDRDGRIEQASEYSDQPSVITAHLLDEARERLQLRAPIPLQCPVRLLHGTADSDVPWQVSQKLMAALRSSDVQLTLIKDGDHRLSSPENLALLSGTVLRLLDQLAV